MTERVATQSPGLIERYFFYSSCLVAIEVE